jgi:hypothetical protein
MYRELCRSGFSLLISLYNLYRLAAAMIVLFLWGALQLGGLLLCIIRLVAVARAELDVGVNTQLWDIHS